MSQGRGFRARPWPASEHSQASAGEAEVMEDKILTQHPDEGKRGRSITKRKYDAVRSAIVGCLRSGPLTHAELMRCATAALSGFEGSIGWYAETVKLDLEARGVIERTATKPERYRLVSDG